MSDLEHLEHRALTDRPEFRSTGGKLVAGGVAMRYGAKSKVLAGQFREVFNPGAFSASVRGGEVRSHLEHLGPYLARTANGSLRLTDSRSELAYELDLPDTSAGRDAAALLERGDIKGSSVGFKADEKGAAWSVGTDGLALRTVSSATLALVDLTTSPAYDDSTAAMALRSLADETGLELRSLIEAAGRGELARLLRPPGRRPPAAPQPARTPRPVGRHDANGKWIGTKVDTAPAPHEHRRVTAW